MTDDSGAALPIRGHTKKAHRARLFWLLQRNALGLLKKSENPAVTIRQLRTEMRQAGFYSPKTVNVDIHIEYMVQEAEKLREMLRHGKAG